MIKTSKRVLNVLLCLSLVFCAFPSLSFASVSEDINVYNNEVWLTPPESIVESYETAPIPEQFGESHYPAASCLNIMLMDVEEDKSFTVKMHSDGRTGEEESLEKYLCAVGFNYDQLDELDPDELYEGIIENESELYSEEDRAYEISVQLVDGSAWMIMYYYKDPLEVTLENMETPPVALILHFQVKSSSVTEDINVYNNEVWLTPPESIVESYETATIPEQFGESHYPAASCLNITLMDVEDDKSFTVKMHSDGRTGEEESLEKYLCAVGFSYDQLDELDPDELYEEIIENESELYSEEDRAYEISVQLVDGSAWMIMYYYKDPLEVTLENMETPPVALILHFLVGQQSGDNPYVGPPEVLEDDVLIKLAPEYGQLENENALYHILSSSTDGTKYSTYLIVPKEKNTVNATLTFTSSDYTITVNGVKQGTILEDNTLQITLNAGPRLYANRLADDCVNEIKVSKDNKEKVYTLYVVNQRFDDLPDAVIDFLCIGSQYTNGYGLGDYGVRAVRSLVGSNETAAGLGSGPVSLGNFGGYITYYFEDAINDDPNNPYGVDFIVFGNCFEPSQKAAEPGQVWVSENGEDWYALAGAIHYEDYADWSYEMTYTKTANGGTSWTDSKNGSAVLDGNGLYIAFPLQEMYPWHTFANDEENSITLKGICFIPESEDDSYHNVLPPYAAFGYADTGMLGTVLSTDNTESWGDNWELGPTTEAAYDALVRNIAGNPYEGSKPSDGSVISTTTDGMDLAWAVDTDGNAVSFKNGIHYVKIVTASNINNDMTYEKSTEVNMVRVARANDNVVGVSDPVSISIDGNEVVKNDGTTVNGTPVGERKNVFCFDDIAVDGEFEVKVDASEGSHVYINNNPEASVTYSEIPNHKIVRVIVQNDECEPLIYVFNLREMTDEEKADAAAAEAAKAVDEKIEAIGDVTLESAAAIKAARDAYEALDDTAKDKVEKLDTLTAAEAKLKELQDAASKEEADAAAAKGVSDAIAALGDDISLDDEKTVESARAAYNALTDDQKALVTNEDTLKAAEAKIAQLKEDTPKAQAVEKQIAAIGEVTKYKEEEIQSARIAYEALTDSQKALVGNLAVLEAAEKALEDLKSGSGSDDTIKVTFRLIGSTKSTQDVDLSKGEEGYYTAEYQNWIKTRTYTMHSDDSVYDLFVKATSDAGIESKGANKGYVSSIKAPESLGGYWLSEFTNGKYSGWMYTMDGKHTNAIKDQKLKDGADVIFHYVNDYRYEVKDWFDEPAYPAAQTDGEFYNRWLEAADVRPGSQTPAPATPETPAVDPENPGTAAGRFKDVSANDWFAGSVDYAVEKGFMTGTGADTFSPDKELTRGMLVSMLYSLEGVPAEDGKTAFGDVKTSDWFAKGVDWAVENGVAAGYGENFGPNDDITREQMVVMLYGYAKLKGYTLAEGADLSAYKDTDEISAWALEAVRWAKGANLITGRSADMLAPKGTTTRAEAATILRNFLENVAK